MTNSLIRRIGTILTVLFLASCSYGKDSTTKALFSFEKGFDTSTLKTIDSKITLTRSKSLRIRTGKDNDFPSVIFTSPDSQWDFSKYEYISFGIKNLEDKPLKISFRVDGKSSDDKSISYQKGFHLQAKESRDCRVRFSQTQWLFDEEIEFIGMRGEPGKRNDIDSSNITQFLSFVASYGKNFHKYEITGIEVGGETHKLDNKKFIPFINEYGQFIHSDWPGKTKSQQDLIKAKELEEADLAKHPGSNQWNKYGGWAKGPQFETKGHFYTKKYLGKWWLIDPDGKLFWSNGIDCVWAGIVTPITNRQNYFKNLPDRKSEFGNLYGQSNVALRGYYVDHLPYKTYDFGLANMIRKYGNNWKKDFLSKAHTRLKSWGLNTIGNWSSSDVYSMKKTAYVTSIHNQSRPIEASEGVWRKFPDPFDKSFSKSLTRSISREVGKSIDDPWCIGYFVNNELTWGNETSLSIAALKSPADQPVKKAFVEHLKKKYQLITKLNSAWKSNHQSWQSLLESTDLPDEKRSKADLEEFYSVITDKYFKTISEIVKQSAPDKLYLGCRFAGVNSRIEISAAKYCDVVSYNLYYYSVENFKPVQADMDKPVIIGEFHFGALDRGMFHGGLCPVKDQAERAQYYKSYIQGALKNKYIVGAHWFQYKDEATTGRFDGENYQIGFVDVCDKPYYETINASREIGYQLYNYRAENQIGLDQAISSSSD